MCSHCPQWIHIGSPSHTLDPCFTTILALVRFSPWVKTWNVKTWLFCCSGYLYHLLLVANAGSHLPTSFISEQAFALDGSNLKKKSIKYFFCWIDVSKNEMVFEMGRPFYSIAADAGFGILITLFLWQHAITKVFRNGLGWVLLQRESFNLFLVSFSFCSGVSSSVEPVPLF